jgi:hypothetical protein
MAYAAADDRPRIFLRMNGAWCGVVWLPDGGSEAPLVLLVLLRLYCWCRWRAGAGI